MKEKCLLDLHCAEYCIRAYFLKHLKPVGEGEIEAVERILETAIKISEDGGCKRPNELNEAVEEVVSKFPGPSLYLNNLKKV